MVSGVSAASAQGGSISLVNTQVWVRRYNVPGNSYDAAMQVVVHGAGNVIVTGESPGQGTDFDFATVKYANDGTALWTNRYDGPAHQRDVASFVAVDGADNVYVAGDSVGLDTGPDLAVIKYSSNGVPVWTNRYNSSGTNYDFPVGLAVDAAGNVVVAAGSFYAAAPEFTTLKYDTLGIGVWTNHYNDPANIEDNPVALGMDNSGSVFVTGGSEGTGTGEDYATVKYAGDGTCLWTNRYSRTFLDQPSALTVDRAGNVIVTGDSLGVGPHLYVTIKYANDGTALWTNILVGPTYQGASLPRVVADTAGNVFITGGSPGANSLGDFNVVKLAGNGIPLWTNRYIGLGATNGWIAATITDNAGNFYLDGYSTAPGGSNNDYVTVKYAPNGTPLWTNSYNGSANRDDYAYAMAVDDAGSIYVTGDSDGGLSSFDYATVNYADYLSYTPPPNFTGTDTFAFTAVDNLGNSATGVVTVAVLPLSLQFNTGSPNFHFTSQGLQLQVDGARGTSPVILYTSTNLVDWQPIYTNPPLLGSAFFLDSAATNQPKRFYRARQQP
jgi:hypothetical protein